MKHYNDLSKDIHQQNVEAGWWNNADRADKHLFYTKLMLTVSEVCEAMEGDRKNLADKYLTDLPAFDVELADAMIRLLDLGGFYGFEVKSGRFNQEVSSFMALLNKTNTPAPVGLFALVCQIAQMTNIDTEEHVYTDTVAIIHALAEYYNVSLLEIIKRKREVNRTRKDHTSEARAAEGGKTY